MQRYEERLTHLPHSSLVELAALGMRKNSEAATGQRQYGGHQSASRVGNL